jgi:hypothetical protein
MSSRNKNSSEKINLNLDNLEIPHSRSRSPPPSPRQPKYIFIGAFAHGAYGLASQPYKVNEHASISIRPFVSTPKLMTFINCAPGNVLIGEDDGNDNTKLTNYFRTNSEINITDTANQTAKKQDQDKKIAENFLNYVKSGLATLILNPRDNIEKYKKENPKDVDVCRNSLICNNKVGISHTFANKTFSTEKPPMGISPEDWGVFIYNNNCGIPYGTNIESIYGMRPYNVTNKDGEVIGINFDLNRIISYLTYRYELTDKDYLFLFDYTCNIFAKTVDSTKNERKTRDLGNNVLKLLGFGKKRTNKRSKKRTRKLKKK